MAHPRLRKLLEHEGASFQRVEQRWRPMDLLFVTQVRALLQDMFERFRRLIAAEEELKTLDRADRYLFLLRRQRLWLRQAAFTWKADQLTFVRSVAGFYSDYGAILRLLKYDELRGKLSDKVNEGVL